MPDAQISVIIVNYNSAELAIAAVESVLARNHGGRSVDVHLIDNASLDDGPAVLEAALTRPGWQGRVTFYPETKNHGFGRGNNIALQALAARSVSPEYVFLLNPDARLENETIAILADFLDAHRHVAVAGASIRKPDTGKVTAAFRFPGLVSQFAEAFSFGPVSRLFARWTVPLDPGIPTQQVDWVAGAAMLARLAPLKQAGFFDPDYFLYYEEVDLMHRLKRAGWPTWYVAEACAVHVEGASTNVKSGEVVRRRRPAYLYESWRLYFTKIHGRAYALAAAVAWMTGAGLNLILSRVRGRIAAVPLRFFADFWATGLRPILGLGEGVRRDG